MIQVAHSVEIGPHTVIAGQAGIAGPVGLRAVMVQEQERIDLLKARTLAEGRFLNREELPENFRREHGGILLHVARDGTLLRSGGAGHRFAIARLLNLPEIPAQIGAIHREAVDNGVLASLRRTSRLA